MIEIGVSDLVRGIMTLSGLRTQLLALRNVIVVPPGHEARMEIHVDQLNDLKQKMLDIAAVSRECRSRRPKLQQIGALFTYKTSSTRD